jgi:outer membrane murein-binding lipoprotein Lpp
VKSAGMVVIAALLLAGCGSTKQKRAPLSKSGYEQVLKQTVGSLNAKLLRLGLPARIAPEEAARRIAAVETEVGDLL